MSLDGAMKLCNLDWGILINGDIQKMIHPTPKKALEKILQVADSNFVDVTGGVDTIEHWVKEPMRTYDRHEESPEYMVMVLQRIPDGRYKGAMYITHEDFERQ